VVKSFAGATIDDMEDYLKPIIRKGPESIGLHVGTNELMNLSPKQVAEGIGNLGSQINEESRNTHIVISSLLVRTDKPHLPAKATETNKLLNAICSKNKLKFINHQSINQTCLNSRGLHLNRKGTSFIANNISKFICNA
jgi:lysophospholipase L1-like esterase